MALQERGAAASPELVHALTLLHSYLLVKTLVRLGDHLVRPLLSCLIQALWWPTAPIPSL
jgi:hypothetical protein